MKNHLREVVAQPDKDPGREAPERQPRATGPEASPAADPTRRKPAPAPAGHPDQVRLDKLLDAANAASGHVRNVYLTFLLFGLYLAIIFGATTHEQLLRAAPVTLPLLDVELPLLGFYWVAPALFVLLHLNLLIELYLLSGKLHRLDGAIGRPAGEAEEAQVQLDRGARLYPLPFSHMLVGRQHGPLMRFLFWLIVVLTVMALPVLLLLFGQVGFLPYHDAATTMWHRVLVTLDLLLLLIFWRRIRHPEDHLLVRPGRWLWHQSKALPGTLTALALSWLILTFPGDESSDWGDPMEEWLLAVAPETLIARDVAQPTLSPTRLLFEQLPFLKRNLVVRDAHLVDRWPTQAQIDQHGADLAWQNFGAPPNLRNRDLRHADLSLSILVRGDFRNANLRSVKFERAVLQEAVLQKAILQDANLHGAVLQDANLRDADLRHAQGWCKYGDPCVNPQGADLTDADLGDANFAGVTFENTNLTNAKLDGANLYGADLSNANLRGAWLRQTDLRLARLQSVDLSCDIICSTLEGVDLRGADLQHANLSRNNLRGADLHQAQLEGAELYNTDLQGVSLAEANLQGATLAGADLRSAKLWGVDLRGAMLYGAELQGANLSEANLMGAVLREAALQGAALTCGWFGPPCANLQGADLRGVDLWRTRVDEWGDPAHYWALVDLRGAKVNPIEGATEQWSDQPDVPQLRPGGHRSAPDVMFEPADPLPQRLGWGVRVWATEDDYDQDLAEFLSELACGDDATVHVAQGLARRALGDDGRLYAKRLAERLTDGDDCPPAAGLPDDLRASLRRLAGR